MMTNNIDDKTRELLSLMSEEAFSYMFPGLRKRDILYPKEEPVIPEIPKEPAKPRKPRAPRNLNPRTQEDDEHSIMFSIRRHEDRLPDSWFEEDEEGKADRELYNGSIKAEHLSNEIEELTRYFNLSVEELITFLQNQLHVPKISPMRITRSGRILLSEFGDLEISMGPIEKAVYFLYLKYPKGIGFKELIDHKAELIRFYSALSDKPRETIEDSVYRLCNSISDNSINEKVTRINAAFRNKLHSNRAAAYMILGSPGEPKKIEIDRTLVGWDNKWK